jgi:hypothetical protein
VAAGTTAALSLELGVRAALAAERLAIAFDDRVVAVAASV